MVDAASPRAAEQITIVDEVLHELESDAKPRITVFNKMDLLGAGVAPSEVEGPTCQISALTGKGMKKLLRQIGTLLAAQQERLSVRIPQSRGDLLAALHRAGRVAHQSVEDGEYVVTAYVPPKIAGRVRSALDRQDNQKAGDSRK